MPERRGRLPRVRTEQEGHERPEVVEDGSTAASAVFANSDSEIAGGAGSATDRNPRCRDAHLAGRQEVLIRVRRIRTAPPSTDHRKRRRRDCLARDHEEEQQEQEKPREGDEDRVSLRASLVRFSPTSWTPPCRRVPC
jgi:hypothetical protein